MPRVVNDAAFVVYVYANDHNPPHCHIVWDSGDKVGAVDLRSIAVIKGDTPPKRGMKLIRDSIAEIRRVWNELHPDKLVEVED